MNIDKIINDHNDRNNELLTVYKDLAGFYNISLGCVPIIHGLTERETYLAITAIRNYQRVKNPVK